MTQLADVRDSAITADECLAAVSRPEAGGITLFVGTVRDHSDGQTVTLLEYQAYESMAKKQLLKIMSGIQSEIPDVRLAVLHRVGALKVGDIAVICSASAPHRGEAFTGARALIDRIKADVPIWKREHGPDGPYWVDWKDARCVAHDHE